MKKVIGLVLVAIVLMMVSATAQQYAGGAQQGAAQGAKTLKIPPAPPKPKANMDYGNTARAAILGERLSIAAEGNAKVYISEGSAITAEIYLEKQADPYDMAGTMANFTYMLLDIYAITDKANSDILLKVYDPANELIIDARFNNAKNAFDYFKVPETTAPEK
jgi:hypothetical protein